jgi:hypothetical protein
VTFAGACDTTAEDRKNLLFLYRVVLGATFAAASNSSRCHYTKVVRDLRETCRLSGGTLAVHYIFVIIVFNVLALSSMCIWEHEAYAVMGTTLELEHDDGRRWLRRWQNFAI